MHDIRIGLGHDTHRLAAGSNIILGGVSIPHTGSLLGHSDADALLHAVTDALLGAAGLGDIGEMFPDTEEKNKNRNSAEMLSLALEKVRENGWKIVNLDCIVFAERPKLSTHKQRIRQRIAEILSIAPEQVNIKAKTGEKVGPIGREEAISAQCAVLLWK